MTYHNIKIQEIIEIAIKAGNMAMRFYDRNYTTGQKQNKTPITEADIAINDFLMGKLSKYNFPILSEEVKDNFKKRKNANFVWIIDPLDGTADFIQKTDEFSIMIGLVNKKGESILGVVYAPALDELYYAEKNKDAFSIKISPLLKEETEEWLDILSENSKKLQTSNSSIKNGKILTSRNHLGEYEQEIAKKYNMKQISAGSAGLKICWIAKSDAELYINSSNKSGLWDLCATDIILRESGGNIKDKNGDEILYNTEDIMLQSGYIATNKTSKISQKIVI